VVDRVLTAQGIARGSGAARLTSVPEPSAQAKEPPTPSAIAAEIADRLFGPFAKTKQSYGRAALQGDTSVPSDRPSAPADGGHDSAQPERAEAPIPSPALRAAGKKPAPSAQTAIEIQSFVSENDVRRAMTRSEKIFIGRKTILTPSARDLGLEHEVFVETEAGSLR
jgi:hypothetical protein